MKQRRQVIGLCLMLVIGPQASATTHLVRPHGTSDLPTFQETIDAAANGDTIALSDDTFPGGGKR